jgi:hypothetical protein
MTTKDLFNIILKILGFFFIKEVIGILPFFITSFNLFKRVVGVTDDSLLNVIMLLIFILIYVLVSYILIFKSELIINKLKLDQGFDQETIPLNIHRSTILSISIIVIGGLLITEEIPNLCKQLFMYFQERQLTKGQINTNLSYCILAGVKILIGLILVGNQKLIVNFIEMKRKS